MDVLAIPDIIEVRTVANACGVVDDIVILGWTVLEVPDDGREWVDQEVVETELDNRYRRI